MPNETRLLAGAAGACATFALIICIFTIPALYTMINEMTEDVVDNVQKFKIDTDGAWSAMMEVQNRVAMIASALMQNDDSIDSSPTSTLSSSTNTKDNPLILEKRNQPDNGLPSYCNCPPYPASPNCLIGPPGKPGAPGKNGSTGEPGRQGEDGQVGYSDICQHVQKCTDCPAGPIGLPGEQGPPGPTGPSGEMGKAIPSQPGPPGPVGAIGDVGEPGKAGEPGPSGPAGASVIIRKSLPGPKGKPGEPGKIGIPGTIGRPGRVGQVGKVGEAGEPGQPGSPGVMGKPGIKGNEGHHGKDGEYCPCPVLKSKLMVENRMRQA